MPANTFSTSFSETTSLLSQTTPHSTHFFPNPPNYSTIVKLIGLRFSLPSTLKSLISLAQKTSLQMPFLTFTRKTLLLLLLLLQTLHLLLLLLLLQTLHLLLLSSRRSTMTNTLTSPIGMTYL